MDMSTDFAREDRELKGIIYSFLPDVTSLEMSPRTKRTAVVRYIPRIFKIFSMFSRQKDFKISMYNFIYVQNAPSVRYSSI